MFLQHFVIFLMLLMLSRGREKGRERERGREGEGERERGSEGERGGERERERERERGGGEEGTLYVFKRQITILHACCGK